MHCAQFTRASEYETYKDRLPSSILPQAASTEALSEESEISHETSRDDWDHQSRKGIKPEGTHMCVILTPTVSVARVRVGHEI